MNDRDEWRNPNPAAAGDPCPAGDMLALFLADLDRVVAGDPPAGWADWPLVRCAGGERRG
jgi:hypothetical protein